MITRVEGSSSNVSGLFGGCAIHSSLVTNRRIDVSFTRLMSERRDEIKNMIVEKLKNIYIKKVTKDRKKEV